jgi:replicative DNA helicase
MVEDAKAGIPGTIFNYDNDPIEYARWLIAQDTGIDAMMMKNPRMLTRVQLEMVRESGRRLRALPLTIESARGDALWIGRTVRKHVHDRGCRKFAVDYVQQVRNKGFEKPVDDIAMTMSVVRDCNQQLRIPALVASQMNRSIETRGAEDDGAKLSDLRASGSIEQDATIVVFPRCLWTNPTPGEILQFSENRDPRTGRPYSNPKAVPMEMEVKKNRNGDTGSSSRYKWVKSNNRFSEMEQHG